MAKKRAQIGFKGLALAKVTENTLTGYVSDQAKAVPYAGSMTKTPVEANQDLYYDDSIYAQVRNISGETVEIRIAEMELSRMAELGLGVYDEQGNKLEADFNPIGGEYSLRCVGDTVDRSPNYFNYRVFELNTLRLDNFATKSNSITVAEVIMGGVLKRPMLPTVMPYTIMQEMDDGSNKDACQAFLVNGETFPGGAPVVNPPGEPTGVAATPGDGSAVVTFTEPVENGGSPITSYTVTATPTGGGAALTETGAASPITISGLTNDTEYSLTVSATNSAGTGPESTAVTVTPTA